MIRKIIKIDEEKCNGCGLCVPACAEGAIQIIDGKARLVKDQYCDGLGACLGKCPQGALSIEEREAEEFDEAAVHEYLKTKQAPATPAATHGHGPHHGHGGVPGGCPGSRMMTFQRNTAAASNAPAAAFQSELGQWPVQLYLVPIQAPFFQDADLLIAADCAPFAYAGFHQDFLKGRAVAIACPKLDDTDVYLEKLAAIFRQNNIRQLTVAHMEVPCCFGLSRLVQLARQMSGKDIPIRNVTISLDGQIKEEKMI